MQHTPAPELDEETIEAAAARVAAMNLNADKPSFAAEINAIREQTKDLPPLDASHGSKPTKPERKTITVDLTDCPEVYARIKDCAETDDRTLATWLKRYLVWALDEETLDTPPAVKK